MIPGPAPPHAIFGVYEKKAVKAVTTIIKRENYYNIICLSMAAFFGGGQKEGCQKAVKTVRTHPCRVV
jgi:hypothetical protein